ncbi:MAG TPA: hypothetical protein VJA21_04080, partial [Verrucomicrobiae bacterium]
RLQGQEPQRGFKLFVRKKFQRLNPRLPMSTLGSSIWRLCLWVALLSPRAHAGTNWTDALRGMPLLSAPAILNRTNCVDLFLRSFHSNQVVKALIFMPGATDEFYMFRRVQARLANPSPSLLDAVTALTNQSLIHATFRSPMLLLHTEEDVLDADISVESPAILEKMKGRKLDHLLFNDRDWDTVQPALKWPLKTDIRPWRYSRDSWHFYRHSFAAWNLSGWEALQATALAGKSKFKARSTQVVFEPDPRTGSVPKASLAPP